MKIKWLLLTSLLLLATAVKSSAGLILNFDSVNASGGPVDPTAYLAGYGITLTGNNPVFIFSDQEYYGGGVVAASSPNNFLLQHTLGSPNGITYTLNFSTALTDLSFTRIQQVTPNAVAQWTATAYAGATAVGSVSEGYFGGTEPAHTYSIADSDFLTNGGITSLTITANGAGTAGIPSAPIDDLTLNEVNAVPEPGSAGVVVAFGLGAVALCGRAPRRRFQSGFASA